MSDLEHRVEAALAVASATLSAAHAHLCSAAAARLANRLPPKRTIAVYCRKNDLSPVDASWIRMQVLARMGAFCLSPITTVPAGAGRMERIRSAIREWLRVQFAPLGDSELQERLELELAYAGAVILKVHVRNAMRFATAVRPDMSAPAAVAFYVPTSVYGAVYDLAVGQVAKVRFAAMLPAAGSAAPANGVVQSGTERVPPAFVDGRAVRRVSAAHASPA